MFSYSPWFFLIAMRYTKFPFQLPSSCFSAAPYFDKTQKGEK